MGKIKVDKSAEFEKRLAKIHGLGHSSAPQPTDKDNKPRDIRREELRAMVYVFLGKNYDKKKFRQLDGLQKTMSQQQTVLAKSYTEGVISPMQFFDLQTALFAAHFQEIKKVLGARDYRKLFGTNSTSTPQFADRKTFLKLANGCKNKKV